MAFREWFNAPEFSTVASTTSNGADPSTGTLCAEIIGLADSKNYEARFTVGASTAAGWLLEHCLSSGLGSTAIRQQMRVYTGTNQTAEYVFTFHTASTSDRLRIRPNSSFTGEYGCMIQAEILS